MDHGNTRVTSKVLLIKSENVRDPVDVHGGHKISVMHLNPRDGMSYHQTPPLGIRRRVIEEQSQKRLNPCYLPVHLGRREA
jgi:hypothetical protein